MNPDTLPFSIFTIVFEGQPFVEVNIRESLRQADFVSVVEGATDRESSELGIGKRITGIPDSQDGTRAILAALEAEFPTKLHVTYADGKFWKNKTAMVQEAVDHCQHGILMQKDIDEFWMDSQILILKSLFLYGYSDAEFHCRHFWGDTEHYTDLEHKSWGGGTPWRRAFLYYGNRVSSHEPPRFQRTSEYLLEARETRALGLLFWHYSYADPRLLYRKEKFYGCNPGDITGPMQKWREAGRPLEGNPCGRLIEYGGPHPIDVNFLKG